MQKYILSFSLIFLSISPLFANEEETLVCIHPKGTKSVGMSFSYNGYVMGSDRGYDTLLSLVQDAQGSMDFWRFSFRGAYFLKDNLSLGLKFNYKRNELGLDQATLVVSDYELSLGNKYNFSHSYSATIEGRYYFPIDKNKRFSFFSELGLEGGFGQGKTYSITSDELKNGTYYDKYSLSLAFSPGVSAILMKNVAVEVNLDILSLDWSNITQVVNQVDTSQSSTVGINYKINLLSTQLAMVLYF